MSQISATKVSVLPVHTLSFVSTQTGQPIAEIHFKAGEAFLEKKPRMSEVITVQSEFKRDWIKFLCYSVDYDVMECGTELERFSTKQWYSLCLIAFNANRYKLKIHINGIPMYSDELKKFYVDFE